MVKAVVVIDRWVVNWAVMCKDEQPERDEVELWTKEPSVSRDLEGVFEDGSLGGGNEVRGRCVKSPHQVPPSRGRCCSNTPPDPSFQWMNGGRGPPPARFVTLMAPPSSAVSFPRTPTFTKGPPFRVGGLILHRRPYQLTLMVDHYTKAMRQFTEDCQKRSLGGT